MVISKLDNLRRPRIEIPKRKAIPSSIKRFVWNRDEGKCVDCGSEDELDYEHEPPYAIIGYHDKDKIFLRCKRVCHAQKTPVDRKDIAKAKRLEKKDMGTITKKRKPFQNRGFPPKDSRPKLQSRGFPSGK